MLLTSKAGPTMGTTLLQKVVHRSSFGSCEQQITRVGVVEIDFPFTGLGVFYKGRLFKVATVLCVVPTNNM